MDFHTHNLQADMPAIINIPLEWITHPEQAQLRHGATYSVGIHPWWTEHQQCEAWTQNLEAWAGHPQITAIGECGIDKVRGADLNTQIDVFKQHILLSEHHQKPLTIHCVRAFDIIMNLKKEMRPTQRWTIHGFRGKPTLAQQLLNAGFYLSFGKRYNPQSFDCCPESRRFNESDDA
jgi:TatD DNase family protein